MVKYRKYTYEKLLKRPEDSLIYRVLYPLGGDRDPHF
jgi:hypothetical protein